MVEYVVREGPLFEAMIMNREMNNPRFRFLFDNQLPAHCYYRWKLFSILQGDEPHVWRTKPFQMFENGSYWLPPKMNPYVQKQAKESSDKNDSGSNKKSTLSERQRDRLEDLLRDVSTDRIKVGEAMVWCLEHAEAAEDIVEILTDSLSIAETPLNKKLARLYIISDILYNSGAKLPNVSYFRKYFEAALPTIFSSFHEAYKQIDGRLTAENFKQKIMSCFRTWEEWVIYPIDHLIRCQNVFLGLLDEEKEAEADDDVDGQPISPSNRDGSSALPIDSLNHGHSDNEQEDIDGIPVSDDIDGQPIKTEKEPAKPKFVASKWETVDDEVVKAQAMTTSKWETLEEPNSRSTHSSTAVGAGGYDTDDSIDGIPIASSREREDGASSADNDDEYSRGSGAGVGAFGGLSALSAAYTPKQKKTTALEMTEKRRNKLREIEVKVVKYQDELEAGRRSRKSRMSISEQVEAYRNKLLQKELEEAERDLLEGRGSERSERRRKYVDRSRSNSPRRRSSRRSRSRSLSRGRRRRSRSRTPKRSKRSRSKSSERHRHKKYRP